MPQSYHKVATRSPHNEDKILKIYTKKIDSKDMKDTPNIPKRR
jgi:hypothetical protein